MQYSLNLLEHSSLPLIVELANEIYNSEHTTDDRYPKFQVGMLLDDSDNREKFFSMFVLPPQYAGFTQRRAYGVYDSNNVLIAAVGVRRYDHLPSWSISWLLSPKTGAKFIALFRYIVEQLCQIHEAAGMNELFVTYPAHREEAYSRIMLFMRERYFTFVETTISAKTLSPYKFIVELVGQTLQPYDVNVRRYILRRPDMTPASEGGQAKRRQHDDSNN